jgi:hypothetical protein
MAQCVALQVLLPLVSFCKYWYVVAQMIFRFVIVSLKEFGQWMEERDQDRKKSFFVEMWRAFATEQCTWNHSVPFADTRFCFLVLTFSAICRFFFDFLRRQQWESCSFHVAWFPFQWLQLISNKMRRQLPGFRLQCSTKPLRSVMRLEELPQRSAWTDVT